MAGDATIIIWLFIGGVVGFISGMAISIACCYKGPKEVNTVEAVYSPVSQIETNYSPISQSDPYYTIPNPATIYTNNLVPVYTHTH
jgi:hypothetical protein